MDRLSPLRSIAEPLLGYVATTAESDVLVCEDKSRVLSSVNVIVIFIHSQGDQHVYFKNRSHDQVFLERITHSGKTGELLPHSQYACQQKSSNK